MSVGFGGSNVRFSFGLPRGADGTPGTNGSDGAQGPAGPAFAQAVVDSVTTVNPGDPAWVNVSFDGSNVRFHFGVPRGADGATGMTGNDGAPGAQGAPGEVSTADLNNAIASAINGKSNNTNNISTLDNGFGDPDMEALRQKINQVILNGRR
jgi:hypothetical protein